MTGRLNTRRTAALRALAQGHGTRPPSRFPGETQPSGDLPDDPDLAARLLEARDRQINGDTR
ncbi:hypothetical protein [Streptomyces sp. NBC_01506]|uniref:hypothetical protein n=1 Tax=Streptomyces sp. NBC_01506 TaxID=2903887 RepID=UPI003864747E